MFLSLIQMCTVHYFLRILLFNANTMWCVMPLEKKAKRVDVFFYDLQAATESYRVHLTLLFHLFSPQLYAPKIHERKRNS